MKRQAPTGTALLYGQRLSASTRNRFQITKVLKQESNENTTLHLKGRIFSSAEFRIGIPVKPVKTQIVHELLEFLEPYRFYKIAVGMIVICPGYILFCL